MNKVRIQVLICISLVIATFCIYFQIRDHEFTNFDDSIYCCLAVYEDGLTNKSMQWAFTTFSTGNWFPLTFLSHLLDFQLYGSHPKGHHLTNLFLHIVNVLILFIVLSSMTGKLWQSAFVAAMFAFHPLNVESVAWAAERKNVLSTLFWLLTMWAYIYYAKKPSIKKYGLVFLFFIFGLMSKSMLVTLPFTLFLLDYWPLRRLELSQEKGNNKTLEYNSVTKFKISRLVFEKIPFLLLTIGLSIVTFIAQKSFGNMNYTDNLTLSTRFTNAMASYLEYLNKMIWPEKLTMFYPHPGNTLPVWQGIFSSVVLLSITIISIRFIRKAPYYAVGWFWYLGTLFPVIGIVQIGGQAMADRYTYLPLIGIFIIIAWGVPDLISNWRYKEKFLSILVVIIIPALLVTTWSQAGYWKNSITLFRHTIQLTDKKYPNLAIVHNNLGIALFAKKKKEEAIFHYKMAIKLKPNHTLAHYNLGIAMSTDQKNEEAISHYKIAIRLNPNFANAHYNLGVILVQTGDMKKATYHFSEALRLRPDFNKARDYFEYTLLQSRKPE